MNDQHILWPFANDFPDLCEACFAPIGAGEMLCDPCSTALAEGRLRYEHARRSDNAIPAIVDLSDGALEVVG